MTGDERSRDAAAGAVGAVEGNLPGGVDSTHPSLRDKRSNLVGREVRL